jgi:hypothetical protein
MEQQHEDMDYPGAIATGKALLSRGGNGPLELPRIYELLGRSRVVTGDDAGAIASFRKLLALKPEYRAGEDVSPKIRKLLTQTLATWAGRPGLTVVHRPPAGAALGRELELVVKVIEDPEQMVFRLRVSYRLPGSESARQVETRESRRDNVLAIPLGKLGTPGDLRYTVEVLDQNGNVLVRLGDLSRLSVALHKPEPLHLAASATPALRATAKRGPRGSRGGLRVGYHLSTGYLQEAGVSQGPSAGYLAPLGPLHVGGLLAYGYGRYERAEGIAIGLHELTLWAIAELRLRRPRFQPLAAVDLGVSWVWQLAQLADGRRDTNRSTAFRYRARLGALVPLRRGFGLGAWGHFGEVVVQRASGWAAPLVAGFEAALQVEL